jgi:ketosteroid isomerase-like protein
MSQENVEVVRRFYGDPDPWGTFAAFVAPDAEFDFTAVYPDGSVLRGIDEVRRFRDEVPWESLHFEVERLIEVDEERVLALVRAVGVGQLSGVSGEARVAHEFTIRTGLLVRFKVYGDRADALEAAGLRE